MNLDLSLRNYVINVEIFFSRNMMPTLCKLATLQITLFLLATYHSAGAQSGHSLSTLLSPPTSVCDVGSSGKRTKVDNDNSAVILLDKIKTRDDFRLNLASDPDVIQLGLGRGGRFDSVQPVVSKDKVIESDHAPNYSILDYAENVDNLPPKIKEIVEKRKQLKAELVSTNHATNSKRIKQITKKIDALDLETPSKPLRIKNWDADLKKKYNKNRTAMTNLIRENKVLETQKSHNPKNAAQIDAKIARNTVQEKALFARNQELRKQAELKANGPTSTVTDAVKSAELEKLTEERNSLVKTNKGLSSDLDKFNENVRGRMGVLSIPYDVHRKFPSTGKIGLNDEIEALKTATVDEAERVMKKYYDKWVSAVENGIKDK